MSPLSLSLSIYVYISIYLSLLCNKSRCISRARDLDEICKEREGPLPLDHTRRSPLGGRSSSLFPRSACGGGGGGGSRDSDGRVNGDTHSATINSISSFLVAGSSILPWIPVLSPPSGHRSATTPIYRSSRLTFRQEGCRRRRGSTPNCLRRRLHSPRGGRRGQRASAGPHRVLTVPVRPVRAVTGRTRSAVSWTLRRYVPGHVGEASSSSRSYFFPFFFLTGQEGGEAAPTHHHASLVA